MVLNTTSAPLDMISLVPLRPRRDCYSPAGDDHPLASASGPSGEWKEDDFDVLADGESCRPHL
jgi:hypothetical protein